MTKNRAPQRADQLYENLFARRSSVQTLEALSDGLNSIVDNANRLLVDATKLANAKRYSSASFLLATANEEMAKSYILLDMCRLDFARHTNILYGLCRAFYDHVAKHAYNEVARSSHFTDMSHVKEMWDLEITKWWPAPNDESGEPDMPHATYFSREMALYVDFIDYDQKWHIPLPDSRQHVFKPILGSSELVRSRAALKRLRQTSAAGLYSPQCLVILDDVFKQHYVSVKTSNAQIIKLYDKVAHGIIKETGITKDMFDKSSLNECPLYSFVATSP